MSFELHDPMDEPEDFADVSVESEQEPLEDTPELVYPNLNEFVRDWLRHVYARKITGRGPLWWSGEWWASQEAMIRLEALWRAWESLRLDPATGMSVWFRDHADQHMPILMSEHGPFSGSKDKSGEFNVLPHIEPPVGLFTITDRRLMNQNVPTQ